MNFCVTFDRLNISYNFNPVWSLAGFSLKPNHYIQIKLAKISDAYVISTWEKRKKKCMNA